jgi:hypothetical protein
MTFNLLRRLPRFCFIAVQISPEIEVLFQLLLFGLVAFCRILPVLPQWHHDGIKTKRRTQRSVAYHACQYRPRGWQHLYRSAWPLRLRLQSDCCFYCSLWLRTSTLLCVYSSLPTTTPATLFQRTICWLSDGLACLFDRTLGHPGEGPQERDRENERVKMRVLVCVRVFVCVSVCAHFPDCCRFLK